LHGLLPVFRIVGEYVDREICLSACLFDDGEMIAFRTMPMPFSTLRASQQGAEWFLDVGWSIRAVFFTDEGADFSSFR
jgi:hypothetical protein